MTFENYQYTRPNVDEVKEQLSNLIARLISANSTKETLEIFNEYNRNYVDISRNSCYY